MARPKKIVTNQVSDESPILDSITEIETPISKIVEVLLIEPKQTGIIDSAIEFKVDYSTKYKGIKRFENNSILKVSIETAELFEQKGIGKRV